MDNYKMPKTLSEHEDVLVEMITERRKKFDKFLIPAVQTCAQCWMMYNKVYGLLIKKSDLTSLMPGSMGQLKPEVDPLLPYYLKLQAELRLQFQAIGLNWNATPSKINESTQDGVDVADPLTNLYQTAIQYGKK